jgi:hypothetical protein
MSALFNRNRYIQIIYLFFIYFIMYIEKKNQISQYLEDQGALIFNNIDKQVPDGLAPEQTYFVNNRVRKWRHQILNVNFQVILY